MKSIFLNEKFTNYAKLQNSIFKTNYSLSDFDLSGFLVPYFGFADIENFFHLCQIEALKISTDKSTPGFAYFRFIEKDMTLTVKVSQFSEEGNESRLFKDLCKVPENSFFLFRFNGKKPLLQEDNKGKKKETGKSYNDFYIHLLKKDMAANPPF